MSDKKHPLKKESNNSTPTIIAKDLSLEGEIKSEGIIEIEGKIKGTIDAHSIIIRESGLVEGIINAQFLVVKGEFKGNIFAKNVNIDCKANIVGNIEYGILSVEDGASIDGQFKKTPVKE
jgi:cytoskeletal protein CcmA (bactofilin family)